MKSSANKSVQDAVSYIKERRAINPFIGIISGSGWDLSCLIDDKDEIPYGEIPGFPRSTVAGHRGAALPGVHKGVEVILLQGRVHYYEGYPMEEVTFPVAVLSGLGVKYVIITNAAGGFRPSFKPGDLMVITDHINLMGVNPLRGPGKDEGRTRFVDMSQAYEQGLIDKVLELGGSLGMTVHSGILAAVSGPSYETPAEIQMLRILGADAVCMSTVPEVIIARYLGMKILGISVITNYATGLGAGPLRHEDVVSTVASRSKDACRLLSAVIENMPR